MRDGPAPVGLDRDLAGPGVLEPDLAHPVRDPDDERRRRLPASPSTIDFQVGYEKSMGMLLSAISGASWINHHRGTDR